MRIGTAVALIALVAIALSGCIGGLGGPSDASNDSSTEEEEAANDSDVAFQQEVPDSAKTGDQHRHPQWEGEDTKTIFDGTVQAGDCYGIFTTVVITAFYAAAEQRVERGCAYIPLDNGTLVPQGTDKLQVEVDASEARQSGGYNLYTWTGNNSYENPTTTEDEHTWWVELSSDDWDGPHQTRSDYYFFSQAQAQETGGIAHLEGPMEFTITAHKIPNWTAPLAAAHVDHWQLNGTHTFVNDDAIEVLNRTEVVYSCTWPESIQGCQEWGQEVNLSDIIPPGSSEVILAMTWPEVRDCAPVHECFLRANLRSGGSSWSFGDLAASGDGYLVYRYKVPQEVPEDSTYANESQTVVQPNVYQCGPSGPEPADRLWLHCDKPAEWSPEADVTFQMEAWRTPVNTTDFMERRGIGR